MARRSAGILAYRRRSGATEVLLVHPGGPYWSNKDLGAWSIPKGERSDAEDAAAAAQREFEEETGWRLEGPLLPLGECHQNGGKIVEAFATEASFDVTTLGSNLFEMEWPPRSGRTQSFPEVDRAEWLPLPEASRKIIAGQRPFLDRLEAFLAAAHPSRPAI